LEAERAQCEATIQEFNQTHAHDQGVTFVLKRYEALVGGVGRPQTLINPHLDQCDFMILLMGDRWGSPPDLDARYGSGSEEEFHRCVELLEDESAHMRDLLVMFKTLDADRLRDPGPQLQAVMDFRNRVEISKALYYGTFDSLESLSVAVHRKLTEWTERLPPRVPTRLVIPPSAIPVMGSISAAEALTAAKSHASKGLLMQAEATFAVAIENDDPQALADFALFMRRTGRLDQALALNHRLLADKALLAATDPESVSFRVSALANIGVIHRKRGAITQSRDALAEAVETARLSHLPINDRLCYALDNYGYTLLRLDQPEMARAQFEESHRLRQRFGTDALALAQSATNLARVALTVGDFATAETLFGETVEQMRSDEDQHLLANALSGKAEARLRQGSRDGVLEHLEEARAINGKLHNSDGSSIVYGLLSRYYLRVADLANAARYAQLCEREGETTNNYSGRGTAALLHAEIALAKGDHESAEQLLADAEELARKSNNRLLLGDVAAGLAQLDQAVALD